MGNFGTTFITSAPSTQENQTVHGNEIIHCPHRQFLLVPEPQEDHLGPVL